MTANVLAFENGTAILPDQLLPDAVVLCDGGLIRAVGRRQEVNVPAEALRIDAGGGYVSPGFVDIHVHGGGGADFMDGEADAVRTAVQAHTRHGTTTIFPTTTTGSPQQIRAMLEACRQVRDGRGEARHEGGRIGGVHFYGPYFAADRLGAHGPEGRRDPDAAEYLEAFESGIVRVATCAAELPGADRFYREAARRGCLVTCGHSNATWDEMQAAFEAGMRHVDHFWCAMSSVPGLIEKHGTPMRGSMEQFVLMHEQMSTEVLADGYHLAPELLEFAFRMKGAKRLCLVTDSNRALDMPPGRYRIGPREDGKWFQSNGRVGLQGDVLASSIVGMDTMLRQMKSDTSADLPAVVRMASLTPAERAGVPEQIGSLEVGKRADVLVLDPALHVKRVFIDAQEFTGT